MQFVRLTVWVYPRSWQCARAVLVNAALGPPSAVRHRSRPERLICGGMGRWCSMALGSVHDTHTLSAQSNETNRNLIPIISETRLGQPYTHTHAKTRGYWRHPEYEIWAIDFDLTQMCDIWRCDAMWCDVTETQYTVQMQKWRDDVWCGSDRWHDLFHLLPLRFSLYPTNPREFLNFACLVFFHKFHTTHSRVNSNEKFVFYCIFKGCYTKARRLGSISPHERAQILLHRVLSPFLNAEKYISLWLAYLWFFSAQRNRGCGRRWYVCGPDAVNPIGV